MRTSQPDRKKAVSTSLKLLVSGVFAAGKSTLCKLTADALRVRGVSIEVVGEVPRRCPYALNQDQTPLASAWLIGEQIRAETEAVVRSPSLVICDRGMPDIISHTTVLRPGTERDQELLRSLVCIAKAWCRSYDLVFWARSSPDREIEEDAVRVPDKQYQAFLEDALQDVWGTLGLSPEVLPQETAERVAFCVEGSRKLLGL